MVTAALISIKFLAFTIVRFHVKHQAVPREGERSDDVNFINIHTIFLKIEIKQYRMSSLITRHASNNASQ
jgi:hypothetical protein